MERKSFIRSLLTLAAAPKLIAKLNIPMKAAPLPVGGNAALFGDLQLLTPNYYTAYFTKYGDQSFVDVMNAMAIEHPLFPSATVAELKDGKFTVREVGPEEIYEPVAITLTNNYNQ